MENNIRKLPVGGDRIARQQSTEIQILLRGYNFYGMRLESGASTASGAVVVRSGFLIMARRLIDRAAVDQAGLTEVLNAARWLALKELKISQESGMVNRRITALELCDTTVAVAAQAGLEVKAEREVGALELKVLRRWLGTAESRNLNSLPRHPADKPPDEGA